MLNLISQAMLALLGVAIALNLILPVVFLAILAIRDKQAVSAAFAAFRIGLTMWIMAVVRFFFFPLRHPYVSRMAQADLSQIVGQNAQARDFLLASAPRIRKRVTTLTVATPAGTEQRIKLFNAGILTSIDLIVTCTLNISVLATAGARAPWNVFSSIVLRDFDGTNRLNMTGFQAWLWQSIKQGRAAEWPLNVTGLPNNGNSYANPVVPTAVNAAATLRFPVHLDVAYDERSDLRGAMLMQTDAGEAFLILSFPAALVGADVDSVYTAGTVAFTSVTIEVYQNYLNPLAVGQGVPLPLVDLSTVYELAGQLRSNDNIAVGAEKLINYPNVRTIVGVYAEYVNNGALNAGTDISLIRTLANGNTALQEWTPFALANVMRRALMSDIVQGCYYVSHRQRPVETAQYGTVQLGITFSNAAGGNQYVGVMFESTYPKGSILSGLQQS